MGLVNQSEINLSVLANHLDNSGWDVMSDTDELILHTENGIAFNVLIDLKRLFVILRTYLPVRSDFLGSTDYCNQLNINLFMGRFAIDSDNDLRVCYVMSIEKSLELSQFSRIVLRFASLLEHVVLEEKDLVFDFNKYKSKPKEALINLPTTTITLQ